MPGLMTEARILGALSATNEAILRASSKQELFQRVCDAAVGTGFRSASILVPESDGALRDIARATCDEEPSLTSLTLSIRSDSPYGQGLAGTAFRNRRTAVSNDIFSDARLKPWYDISRRRGVNAAAAVPIVSDGVASGVILVAVSEAHSLTPEIVALIERMAENVAFGLAAFALQRSREQISRMYAALSATNEAILRATSREELYSLVCDAAFLSDTFLCTRIAFIQPDQRSLRIVAAAGRGKETAVGMEIPVGGDGEESQSAGEIAFRTSAPCISNEYQNDPRMTRFQARLRDFGTQAVAAFPLITNSRAIGQITFQSDERGAFTTDLIDLLQRLTDNLSFALINFERADEKKQAEDRIRYLASHDSLTGLPNRAHFASLLEDALCANRECALLFIDLDRFKIVNDSLGHTAGDRLLIEVATRLRGAIGSGDLVARLGGDEFVVIVRDNNERSHAAAIAQSVLEVLAKPISLDGHECHVTASIGIARAPADGSDAETLIKHADGAMYRAKDEGKSGYRFAAAAMKGPSLAQLQLETSLRRALELDEFALHYQPKLDARTERITGVEALLRWSTRERGNMPPATFIPLAEETGLIIPIGRWVLRTACAQAVAWDGQGLPSMTMAVNLSPRQFLDDALLHDIDQILTETGLKPERLQLEITESAVMTNMGRAVEVLNGIQARGIRLAIDDFGTGYSSMSLMKRFPIDTIKIDRSFVSELEFSKQDRTIATAIITMAKGLGLTVVAEGVETREQSAFLQKRSCDELQGFLFSRPVPADAIAALVTSSQASPPLQPSEADLTSAVRLPSRALG